MKIHKIIDEDLEDIFPSFLERRGEEVKIIQESLNDNDFEKIRVIGHKLKGNAGGYGLPELGEVGAKIEIAAKNKDKGGIEVAAKEMDSFLGNLEYSFAPLD